MIVKLVPYDAVAPSTYNPRTADEKRLALVALSLSKLGFVLPIVAHRNGEIVSGHQRHLVAGRLGFDRVPVQYIDAENEADRKALNIVFNRGTNDMSVTDHSQEMAESLLASKVEALAARLPDAANPYRCAGAKDEPLSPLAANCRARYNPYMRNMARALYSRAKIKMPIVVSESGEVLNGIGRVQYGMERRMTAWPVVRVTDQEAEFSKAMLNLLSMDFDIHTKYEDVLRHNSFRRARTTRSHLGTGFTAFLPKPPKKTKDFDIQDAASAETWRRVYGESIVDFGAGHLHETELLRGAGVYVSPFEPFRCGEKGNIRVSESIDLARAFLRDVRSGRKYSSVFVSSVFNSVPFTRDRECIVRICAALCGDRGIFYGNAMSVRHTNFTSVSGSGYSNERNEAQSTFALQYEGGVVLGDFMDKPKVQKYHTGKEFYDLLKTGFESASVKAVGNTLFGKAARPIVESKKLREALEFEFNLLYPDGSRMGLAEEAVSAFSERLGVRL